MATPTTTSLTDTYVSDTADYRFNALNSHYKWGGGAGSGVTITYSFPSADGGASYWSTSSLDGYNSFYADGEPWDPDFRGLTSISERDAVRSALQLWSDVANINFAEVDDNSTTVGDIRFAVSGVVEDFGAGAWAYLPGGVLGGDVWLNHGNIYDWGAEPGSYEFNTLLHEIGHALGLTHPFEHNNALSDAEDNQQYTLMSYDLHPTALIEATTPMLYDVLAIQYLYGANTSTRSGDTVYAYDDSQEILETIWDGGGNDTIDLSQSSSRSILHLEAGEFSSVGRRTDGSLAQDNLVIAFGAEIENAIGGTANDQIAGNSLSNLIEGRNGNDTLTGRSGSDTLLGGSGDDMLFGGTGDDILSGGIGNDTLNGGNNRDTADYSGASGRVVIYLTNSSFNSGADGKDTLISIEDLLGSDYDDHLIGDSFSNTISGGGGDDVIKGKGGADTILGDGGDDKLRGGDDTETIYGGDDSDILLGIGGDDMLFGEAGDDFLYGGRDNDMLVGDNGADRLRGNRGNDHLDGGGDADDLRGGGGSDTLLGGAGNDFLLGDNGADILDGGLGDDILNGTHLSESAADIFVYKDANYGFDRVRGFEDGKDTLDLTDFGFTDFDTEVLTLASDTASGLKIDFGLGNILFVEDFLKADFTNGDVLL